jgi:hypothetical protein
MAKPVRVKQVIPYDGLIDVSGHPVVKKLKANECVVFMQLDGEEIAFVQTVKKANAPTATVVTHMEQSLKGWSPSVMKKYAATAGLELKGTIDVGTQIAQALAERANKPKKAKKTSPAKHSQRALEKQRSRDQDARDLASGAKSRKQMRAENGSFAFPSARIRLGVPARSKF